MRTSLVGPVHFLNTLFLVIIFLPSSLRSEAIRIPDGTDRFNGRYNLAAEVELHPDELQYLVNYFDWSSFEERLEERRRAKDILPFLEDAADEYLTLDTLETLPKALRDKLKEGLNLSSKIIEAPSEVLLVKPQGFQAAPARSPPLQLLGANGKPFASQTPALLGQDGKPIAEKLEIISDQRQAPALANSFDLGILQSRWRKLALAERVAMMRLEHLPKFAKAHVGLLLMTSFQDTPEAVELPGREDAPEPFKKLLGKMRWHRQHNHFEMKIKQTITSPREYLSDLHLLASYVPGMWKRLSEPQSGRKQLSYHFNISR